MKINLRKSGIAALLMSVLLVAGLVAGCGSDPTPALEQMTSAGSLLIRVNPEIKVSYDQNGSVTAVEGKNDDGRAIVQEIGDASGKQVKEVVNELVNKINEAGYFIEEIDGSRRSITFEIESGSRVPSEDFIEQITSDVENLLTQMNANVAVQSENSDYDLSDYTDESGSETTVSGLAVSDYSDYSDMDDDTDYDDSDYGDMDNDTDYDDTDYSDTDDDTDYDDTDYDDTDYDDTDYTDYSDSDYDDRTAQTTTDATTQATPVVSNSDYSDDTDYDDTEYDSDYDDTDYTDYSDSDYDDRTTQTTTAAAAQAATTTVNSSDYSDYTDYDDSGDDTDYDDSDDDTDYDDDDDSDYGDSDYD